MSDEISLGLDDDDSSAEGIEVPGNLPTPLETLLDWTNQVSALKIAAALFPDLEAVVDNAGYFGPSPDPCAPDPGFCWLLCRTQDYAQEVWRYLDDHSDVLNLVPELQKTHALVVIHYHKFD